MTTVFFVAMRYAAEQTAQFCERVDRREFQGNVRSDEIHRLIAVGGGICRSFGSQTHVLYEAGFAHAL